MDKSPNFKTVVLNLTSPIVILGVNDLNTLSYKTKNVRLDLKKKPSILNPLQIKRDTEFKRKRKKSLICFFFSFFFFFHLFLLVGG